jgi:hypothetical protein
MVMLVVVAAMLAGVLGSYWFVSSSHASELVTAARSEAIRLERCVPPGVAGQIRATLALAYPDDRPLAGCAALASGLADSASKLEKAALLRERAAASELVTVAARLSQFGWDAPARSLHDGPVLAELSADLAQARQLACRIASGEGRPDDPACAARAPAAEASAPPLTVIDAEFVGEAAWTANAAASAGFVAITARDNGSASLKSWLARSLDGGRTWRASSFEPAAATAERSARPPDATLLDGGALLVAHFAPRSERGWSVRVARWRADAERIESSSIFELPEPWRPIAVGSPLLPVSGEPGFALALRAGDPARAAIWIPPSPADEASRPSLLTPPAGLVLAAISAPPSRLLIGRKSPTGFVELVAQPIPHPGEPWPEPRTSLVSYVSDLSLHEAPERWCGLAGEQYFTTIGDSPDGNVLVAVGSEQIYPFRFTPRSGASVGVLCGACPPAGIERSAEGVRVLLPVRRQLSPATVTTPIAFAASSVRSAAAACTGEQLVVAYLAGDRVLAQSTRSGQWQFERPQVLAVPDARGKPADLRVLGFDDRVLVLWRRTDAQRRSRIEAAEVRAE